MAHQNNESPLHRLPRRRSTRPNRYVDSPNEAPSPLRRRLLFGGAGIGIALAWKAWPFKQKVRQVYEPLSPPLHPDTTSSNEEPKAIPHPEPPPRKRKQSQDPEQTAPNNPEEPVQDQQTEFLQNPQNNLELIDHLLNRPALRAPRKTKKDRDRQAYWKDKFENPRDPRANNLLKGWERMVTSVLPDGRTHLQMIHEKCQKYGIPFDVCFLALNESYWKNNEMSFVGASGPWQFMPKTARAMGLKNLVNVRTEKVRNSKGRTFWRAKPADRAWWKKRAYQNDDRSKWEESTEAAMKLLRENYDRTAIWDRQMDTPSKATTQDRWLFAMWQYNMSPYQVGKIYKKVRGVSAQYSSKCRVKESYDYVNKVFTVAQVIKEYEKRSDRSTQQTLLAKSPKTTKDIQYQNWVKKRDHLTPEQNQKELKRLSRIYSKNRKVLPIIRQQIEIYTQPQAPESENETTLVASQGDRALAYWKENQKRSYGKKLEALEIIRTRYQKDLENRVHTETYIQERLTEIQTEEVSLLQQYLASTALDPNLKKHNIKIDVDSEAGGFVVTLDRINPVTQKVENVEADIVTYTIPTGTAPKNALGHTATRLSGDGNISGTVRQLIKALNPEAANANYWMKPGQKIRVPGEYREVPRTRNLDQWIQSLYPKRPLADAKSFLAYLNGINPIRGIRPGDYILVPIFRSLNPEGQITGSVETNQKTAQNPLLEQELTRRSVIATLMGRGRS